MRPSILSKSPHLWSSRFLRRAPSAISVVTAIVGIPAQHVPKLRPGQQFPPSQNPRRQQPRPGATGLVQLGVRQNAKMFQKYLHPRDALSRAANMPALAAIGAARTGKTIVGAKNDTAAAKNLMSEVLCAGLFQVPPSRWNCGRHQRRVANRQRVRW